MNLIDLKCLLLKLGMTVTDLARELHCSRYSITACIKHTDRPGIRQRLDAWYAQHRRRVA